MPHTPFHKARGGGGGRGDPTRGGRGSTFLEDYRKRFGPPEGGAEEGDDTRDDTREYGDTYTQTEGQTLQDILNGQGFGNFADYAYMFGPHATQSVAQKYNVDPEIAEKYLMPFEKERFNALAARLPEYEKQQLQNITTEWQISEQTRSEQEERVSGRATISKMNIDEMQRQRKALFGEPMDQEDYNALSDLDKKLMWASAGDEGPVIGGLTGRQLGEEKQRLVAEYGEDLDTVGGFVGRELQEAGRQIQFRYGEDPNVPGNRRKIEGAMSQAETDFARDIGTEVGGIEGQKLIEIRKQLQAKFGEDLKGELGGAAGERLNELAVQIAEEYGGELGKVGGLTGKKATEIELQLENKYGVRVDPTTGEKAPIGGTVEKQLGIGVSKVEEQERRLKAQTAEQQQRLTTQYGAQFDETGEPIDVAGISGTKLTERQRQLTSFLGEQEAQLASRFGSQFDEQGKPVLGGTAQDQMELAREATQREFVRGTGGLRQSFLQQKIQQSYGGPGARGFAGGAGQPMAQRLAQSAAQESFENLRTQFTAQAKERGLQTERQEEAMRAGYASVDEARAAGTAELNIAQIEAEEARRRGYASADEAKAAGEADLAISGDVTKLREEEAEEVKRKMFSQFDIQEESDRISRRRSYAGMTAEEKELEEQKRKSRQALVFQARESSEAGRAAREALGTKESRAEEAARQGGEDIEQKALRALEQQAQMQAKTGVSEAERAEMVRAGEAQYGEGGIAAQMADFARQKAEAQLGEDVFAKKMSIESLLTDFIRGQQQTLLRLGEMNVKPFACPAQTVWSEDQGACVPVGGDECPDGQIKCADEAGTCVDKITDCPGYEPPPSSSCEEQCKGSRRNPQAYQECIAKCEGNTTAPSGGQDQGGDGRQGQGGYAPSIGFGSLRSQ